MPHYETEELVDVICYHQSDFNKKYSLEYCGRTKKIVRFYIGLMNKLPIVNNFIWQ